MSALPNFDDPLAPVLDQRNRASNELRSLILPYVGSGFSREIYVRYLSMQLHLTNDVQRYFFACAAHSEMAPRPNLRKFLLDFGMEEEPHFRLAAKDLEDLNSAPLPPNLDVLIWKAYFDKVTAEHPFIRLGATVILEGITDGCKEELRETIKNTKFLTTKNSRFLRVHMHDELPHGNQIISALREARLERAHLADLETGAAHGGRIFLRSLRWAITGHDV